jgi:hypothetical protein
MSSKYDISNREELIDPRTGETIPTNIPIEEKQSTLDKYIRSLNIKKRIESLVPSCNNCTSRFNCDLLRYKDEKEDRIKCLKRRVYQFSKLKYNLFDINREDSLFDVSLKVFWNNIKKEETNKDEEKKNTTLNIGDSSRNMEINSYG